MDISKTIQKSLPKFTVHTFVELGKVEKLFDFELGTPNLGTLWILDFVTVSYEKITTINKSLAAIEFAYQASLLEDNFLISEKESSKFTTAAEPEESEVAPFKVEFQFPQSPILQGGHAFRFRGATTFPNNKVLLGKTAEARFEGGQISIGYRLVDNHAKR